MPSQEIIKVQVVVVNTAGVKIQLEYDLLSGQFLNVQLGPGKNNDKTYGTIWLETVEAGVLC
ncbi:hypothetical protein J2S17_001459 [Cytobacillus purgationiresistens]|uniref:Transposase IS4-like domain-containing protein n=1 Tax=Cytobacillus purgationiresistens TaxID=863449 RepID=A0ABU0AFM7_9BACI|nr:hypothetical protein [Cytobacillus purgationiresistens]